MTYTIQRNNDIGPDETRLIRTMGHYFPFFIKPLIFNWCINQHDQVLDQLNGGIRYFDLRVAVKNPENRIHFLHGLYGVEITEPLQQISTWLRTHPHEVVILDFQHFYKFEDEHHRYCIDRVKTIFHGKLCPVHNKFDNVTLEWLNSQKYQVFVVYRNMVACNISLLWPSGFWPTPWPNTVNPEKLTNFLNNALENRLPNLGFISQCLLTPNSTFVIRHIFGNLDKDLGSICRSASLAWIKNHDPGKGGLNIVITDYVSFNNFLFCKIVIQKNILLL